MMRPLHLSFLLLPVFLSGCRTQSYFLSPFNGNSHPYIAKPLLSDSVKSAIYADGTFSINEANIGKDDMYDFSLSLHRSHTFRRFQAYYGGSFFAGNYKVRPYSDADLTNRYYRIVNMDAINQNAGNKYFTGLALHGGVNFVIPLGKHEWRIIGIETNLGKEWGDYYEFRKNLPDSASSVIVRNDRFGSIGITTEFAFKRRYSSMGFKFALGSSFYRTADLFESDPDWDHSLRQAYFSSTFQYTRNRYTGFTQFNVGSYIYGIQFGLTYKLTR